MTKRQNGIIRILVLTGWLIGQSHSQGAADILVEFFPGSLVAHASGDDFKVSDGLTRESIAMVSTMPNIRIGTAIAQPEGYFDFTVGAGILLGNRVRSIILSAGAGMTLEYRPSILMGPHVNLLYGMSPDWWGDIDVNLDSSIGYEFGFHMVAGDRIAYLFSLDYVSLAFDAEPGSPGVTVSQAELDLSGIAIQFGVRSQF
ncbi:MAG: hypothetical protein A2498_09345 [Lentisphaerae bacterium RIFOXYC12_FULL_60_16]|nr:MAG: hypothetical protein A2498_09345 [Lentisphaerae bacterium RIFOXYC12_FULL_60_16]